MLLNAAFAAMMLLSRVSDSSGQVTFTKVTSGDIVTDLGNFASFTWADFRNSGQLDLFVANNSGANVFYQNSADGTFRKIIQGAPIQDFGFHVVPVAADFDNDGRLDLFLSAGAGASAPAKNAFYHNEGNLVFTSLGGSAANLSGFFNGAAAADYDNDGWVDLFAVNLGDASGDGGRNLLLRNNGDGTFDRISTGDVVTDFTDGSNACWTDYDGDGAMDLMVFSTGSTASLNHIFLYHNNKDGTLTRVLTNSLATDTWSDGAWGASWGDYDNDGLPDLFVTGLSMGNRLYHNDGNGRFSKVSSGPMLAAPPGEGARSCAWGDYDNDGYLDLFVLSHNAPNRLFHNNGDGTFTQVLEGDPLNDGEGGIYSEACGWVDYDNDGFLDLFVTRIADNNSQTSNLLYHNNGGRNAWLKVSLVGTVGNRSAIGAKVRVRATIGGKSIWQLREINNGSGRWSQPLVAHFGLGDTTNIDMVRIEWPSGTVQEFQNVAPNQAVTYTEPSQLTATRSSAGPAIFLRGGNGLGKLYSIESSVDLLNWVSFANVFITNSNGIRQIDVDSPQHLPRKFYRAKYPAFNFP